MSPHTYKPLTDHKTAKSSIQMSTCTELNSCCMFCFFESLSFRQNVPFTNKDSLGCIILKSFPFCQLLPSCKSSHVQLFFYLQSIVWETLPHWWPRHIFNFPGNIDIRYIPGNLNIFVWLGNESGPYFFKWLKVYWRYLYTGLGLSVPVDIHTRQFVQSLTPTSWFCRCYSKFLSKFLRFSTSVQSQNPWPMILTSAP